MPRGDAADAYRTPIGTHDVLPPESARWTELIRAFAERARRFGYDLIVTPVFEHAEVFERLGESTDVVSKEMYEFTDRGGRRLALRPEGTAPVVRAYVQHKKHGPWKVWYLAPLFRYERPQKGRYRQHWQLGVEVLGLDDPDVDVEVIAFGHGLLRELGVLGRTTLLLNSMGDRASRAQYVGVLREYLLGHGQKLGEEFRERVETNPLRVLDSKREDWQDVIERAPQLTEHLSDKSREHFEQVQRGLDELGIHYELAPRLVRGFDYYTSTTFEFVSDALDAAQNAVLGGGRYDNLVEEMGGQPTPGIGFGLGIERLLIVADAVGALPPAETRLDAFVVDGLTRGREALALTQELREAGLRVDRAYGNRSVSAQWNAADRAGAAFGVMLAPDEFSRGELAVKDLRTGRQVEVPREQVVAWLRAHREFDR
ncbi:MAG TPA: histidine--tRNA ligase [Acidimicrobiia bacterium]|nr:histidine--tRNA ligase [Acidimicrobiia bacterium]